MSSEPKPAPFVDELTRGFWEACARHELRIQRCVACGRFRHFPLPACPACGSVDSTWAEVSGRGSIYSFVIVAQSVTPGFGDDVPYVVAWVELVEQQALRLVCNVLDCDPADVAVGAPVEICFEDRPDGVTVPQCRLAPGGEAA